MAIVLINLIVLSLSIIDGDVRRITYNAIFLAINLAAAVGNFLYRKHREQQLVEIAQLRRQELIRLTIGE